MTQDLSQRHIFRFWIPLAAMWVLMALEQPFLGAVIARLDDPKLNLAAYGLTFSLALLVESPVIMFLTMGTALARDRQSYRLLMQFTHFMAWSLTALHLLIGLTPIYGMIVGGLVGAPAEVVEPSRTAFLFMTPWAAAIAYRRLWQGVLIRFQRTGQVAIITAVRVAATVLVAVVGLQNGSIAGANLASLCVVAGVLVSAMAAWFYVRPVVRLHLAQEKKVGTPLTWPSLLRFYTPLAMTSFITLAGQPIISLGLSRGPRALESLAVWPVINGLLFLFRSTGVAFQEVVVALLKDEASYRALRRFAHRLAMGLSGLLAVICLTPLANAWFVGVAGLSPELASIARIPAMLLILVPGLTALTSWQRGVLIHFGRTSPITVATALNIGLLLITILLATSLLPLPGAIIAALALTLSLSAEVAFLTRKAHGTLRRSHTGAAINRS
ncbi:MAG: hypothetical protein U9R25_06425 [Chloroflexota bacterium]|nr:hypothetical protein [Chloroflexota bacterium]